MKTSNIPFPMLVLTALILCFSIIPVSSTVASIKNQVGIKYTSEEKWQPEGKFKKTFRTSNCTAQVKFPPRKAKKHKLNCYKFK